MKTTAKYLILSGAVFGATALLQSCAMDAPFGDGNGTLSVHTEMNGTTAKTATRGVPDNNDELLSNCVVFIENSRGVMRKYKGVENIPTSISLTTGDYVCNAWAGDSVAASFSSKFYRGQQKFEILENQNTSCTVKCNIANVVVSVNPESLNVGLKDMKVTFSTTRGELEFTEANIATDKGYFMTPSPETESKDPEAYAKKTAVTVKIEGTKDDGSKFEKTHVIEKAKRAHEYEVTVTSNPQDIQEGGALIQLIIKDIPIIEDTIEIFPAPQVKGLDFDMEEQVASTNNTFKDTRLYIVGYGGLSSVTMTYSDNFGKLNDNVNILEASKTAELDAEGVKLERKQSVDAATGTKVDELYVTFTAAYLNGLAAKTDEMTITFGVTDERHYTGQGVLHIANTEDALAHIDEAFSAEAPVNTPMAITSTKATLSGRLTKLDAADYGIEYRKSGESEWKKASAKAASGKRTRASQDYTVTITGLEAGATYEFRAYADGFSSDVIRTFTTEAKYQIPNASMEQWNTYQAKTMLGEKSVIIPWSAGDKSASFWGSGNEGSATANQTLTDKSTDMLHSGTYSARLESKDIFTMIAAGNLFVGEYVETDGTNGVLSMGRPYNGSHPTKLRVYVNYRPGSNVKIQKGNEENVEITAGGTDHGQIYVALTSAAIDIRTNPNNRKLFNKDDSEVLAYGQVTFKENYGPDGGLQVLEIPFEYNERAKTTMPTHLIITCCASKFGDFFSGSAGSVMYLDDFELIYE